MAALMVDRNEALAYHANKPAGKIEVQSTKATLTQRDLSLAYTPGVAEPCREIAKNPDAVYDYTTKGNLVAVVTNGTAVLGLGNIGPLAGKPVMEGKGVLFKRFAGIDVFDIELDAPDVDTFCTAVKALAPTFGGINLEDVKAPECFVIEERLKRELDIPVFHDDQHGTAIITAAGLLNALILQNKRLEDVRIVFSGAGAAAIATAKLVLALGVKKEQILLCDSKGVVRKDSPSIEQNPYKSMFATATSRTTLTEALDGADVFIGVSVANQVTPEMLAKMASRPVIFALANPDPEIPYDAARKARPDAIVATGRSDFPNQVNNVLGFPFIFRGALDTRAATVNEAMMIAAVHALAELAREEVEDSVSQAYGGVQLRFGPEYIIPKPFDPRVLLRVAPAVALAATLSGVAKKPINDVDAYRVELERLLGKERELMRMVVSRAKAAPRRIVLADGEHEKVLRAAAQILEEGIAQPILIGDPMTVRTLAQQLDLELGIETGRCRVVAPGDPQYAADFATALHRRRQRKGMTLRDAERVLRQRLWFGATMVTQGHAEGMVCGLGANFPDTLRPVLMAVGVASDRERVAGVHLMIVRDEIYFLTDTTLTLDPTAEQMAEIACAAADLASVFDIEPRIAMLSFSNFGSVRNERSDKVRRATDLVRTWRPELMVEGELHADVALMPEVRGHLYPFARLAGRANVLVFPSLEAGNIAQKVMQCAGAQASVGPVLVGLNHPVNIVAPYAGVADLVMATAMTAMLAKAPAQERDAGAELLRLQRLSGVAARVPRGVPVKTNEMSADGT
jgi:malate dehydrogenase (oxaloacetate-decarboxylating)(NADP+)